MSDERDVSMNRRDAFFVWLSGHVSPAQLSELYVMADELVQYCIEKKFVKTSVFAISNRTSVARLCANLEGNRLFKFFNRGEMGRMLTVLKHYIEYLDTTENTVVENAPAIKVQPKPTSVSAPVTALKSSPIVANPIAVEPATTVAVAAPQPIQESVWSDQAYAFRDYLISKGESEKTACVHVRALICIDTFISKHTDEYDPLLEIKDYTQALQIVVGLLSDERFHQLDRENDAQCVAAAQLYIKMLKEPQKRKETLLSKQPVKIKQGEGEMTKSAVSASPLKKQLASSATPIATSVKLPAVMQVPTHSAAFHSAINAKVTSEQLRMEDLGEPADPLIAHLEKMHIPYVDKRSADGCLWIIGDDTLSLAVEELKVKGYNFRYAAGGGKSTNYKPAWYTNGKPTVVLADDLLKIVSDNDMAPLRRKLIEENILTLKQFREVNPWAFMNRHMLYSIGKRQDIYTRIRSRMNSGSMAIPKKLYQFKTTATAYTGSSVSAAFLAFVEHIALKYPLKIRSLIGARYNGNGSVVLSRSNVSGNDLQLMNPVAYIKPNLLPEAAVIYGKWICKMCGDSDFPVAVVEPQTSSFSSAPPVVPSKPITPPAPVAPSKPVTPPAPVIPPKPVSPSAPIVPPKPVSPSQPSELVQEAERLVQEADLAGMSLEALSIKLGTSMVDTKGAIADSQHIVQLRDKLYHDEAFVDWEDGADQMEKILQKLLDKNNGYVSAAQLYEYVHLEMQMFLNDNDMDDAAMVYDMAQHLFGKVNYHGKHLAFQNKKHISRDGAETVASNLDVICNYAREQGGIFKEEDLVEYLQRVGIKKGNLRAQMRVYSDPIFLFYDERMYITAESMGIDDAWLSTVQHAFDKLFLDMGDHVILRDIQPFWYALLPALPTNKAWTPLLLQSVLMHYSKKLNGVHTIGALSTQTADTLHAMIVSGDSEVQTFPDAVAAFLVDDAVEQRRFEAEELRQLLVRRGMIAGNELIWNMPKALAKDYRFAWDADGQHVTIKV